MCIEKIYRIIFLKGGKNSSKCRGKILISLLKSKCKEVSKELASRGHFGECSFDSHTIRVSKDFGTDQYHSTFLHEVVEAVNEENCNYKIKHTEVTNLANGLAQVFKSLGVIFTTGGE